MNYTEDLEIDQDYLDSEWGKQPSLYMQYADASAKADKIRDELKQELTVLKARLTHGVFQGNIAIAKTTADAVKAYVESNEEVVTKGKELIQLQYDSSVLSGAVEAFQHRKKALEKLTDLFVFGWNAEPKAGRVDRIRELKRNRNEQAPLEPQEKSENEEE